jgi:hypothetical protein
LDGKEGEQKSPSLLKKKDITPMLQREEELRFSEDVQQRFTIAESTGNSEWMDVAEELQLQVLTEFKYLTGNKEEDGSYLTRLLLHEYRLAAQNNTINVQIRQNICRRGDLSVGDDAINVRLTNINGENKHLLDYQKKGRPLVVIAGSYS